MKFQKERNNKCTNIRNALQICSENKKYFSCFSHHNEIKVCQMSKKYKFKEDWINYINIFCLSKSKFEENETNNFKIIESQFVYF